MANAEALPFYSISGKCLLSSYFFFFAVSRGERRGSRALRVSGGAAVISAPSAPPHPAPTPPGSGPPRPLDRRDRPAAALPSPPPASRLQSPPDLAIALSGHPVPRGRPPALSRTPCHLPQDRRQKGLCPLATKLKCQPTPAREGAFSGQRKSLFRGKCKGSRS